MNDTPLNGLVIRAAVARLPGVGYIYDIMSFDGARWTRVV